MCIQCYEEAGSPAIINDETKRVAALVDKLYEGAAAGGTAHIVVDDWNLDDGSIEWCLAQPMPQDYDPKQLDIETQALTALLALPMEQRVSAMALHERFI